MPDNSDAYWSSKPGALAPLELGIDGFWLDIQVYDNNPDLVTLYQKLINLRVGETDNGGFKNVSTKLSSLNTEGVQGATFASKPPPNFAGEPAYTYDAVWIRNNKLYLLSLAYMSESNRDSHKGLFNQILTSYKFTN